MPTLKQALKGKLKEQELKLVPSSFNTIGSIALFTNFPKELTKKEKIIASTLMQLNHNIKTVAKKIKPISGKYRLQKVEILAGEKTKQTIHKENGISLKVDIEKCYFSPRTSSERMRIAKQVKPNESILVMFSGIGVLPITISKHSKAKEIYGIDINPEAQKYALENQKLNKVNNITLLKGDVKKIMPKLKKKFSRIIMPFPKDAYKHLSLALKYLNKRGIIHFYDFSPKKEFPESSIKKIKKHCKKFKILNAVLCGDYSPGKFRVCIDFQPL